MANILKLSTRSSDLLQDGGLEPIPAVRESTLLSGNSATKQTADTPVASFQAPAHELLSDSNRRIQIASVVAERRTIGGTPQAEQFINELYSASQINRGPAGFCSSSRLHLDMLLGRDETIGYSDYLNFSTHQV